MSEVYTYGYPTIQYRGPITYNGAVNETLNLTCRVVSSKGIRKELTLVSKVFISYTTFSSCKGATNGI
jgi:hypothetical protein